MTEIKLGFEVGTGEPVSIPLTHMAVTGQTQASGKTTTLEALSSRAEALGITSVAFLTKRGEGAFLDARRTQPYFRDRADWQFVCSIIDATLQEKNKFLRSWIMTICKNTETLSDVWRAVKSALVKAKGINHGVYTQLDHYLELIVPVIARARMASTLDLRHGVNVMDLTEFDTPMQMLFVQSAIDWINKYERETVVIIPEAWKFIPEGKGSPVKNSAISLVREGAGIHNFIWVDSQDMAGVDKVILRGCTTWLIGVQREANEIKRTLNNIPKGLAQPKAAQIAMLQKGQFYACYADLCTKTYVKPAWMMRDEQAIQIAKGNLLLPTTPHREEATVTPKQAEDLRQENADLRRRIAILEGEGERTPSAGTADHIAGSGGGRATKLEGRMIVIDNRDAAIKGHGGNAKAEFENPINEAFYQAIKTRLAGEAPAIIALRQIKPQIQVQERIEKIKMDTDKQPGFLAHMIAKGFFDSPVSPGDIVSELKRRGRSVHHTNVYRDLNRLAEQGFLTIEEGGYQAVRGMKINIVGAD